MALAQAVMRRSAKNIPLSPESPHTPVATTDVLGIQIIQVPSQTAEPVLSGLHQQVYLTSAFLHHPSPVSLHVPFRVAGTDDRHFGLQKLG